MRPPTRPSYLSPWAPTSFRAGRSPHFRPQNRTATTTAHSSARAPESRIRIVHFSARGTQDRITTARSSAHSTARAPQNQPTANSSLRRRAAANAMLDPIDRRLDASLQEFEPTIPAHFAYQSHHSGFRSEAATNDAASDRESDLRDSASAGGYSPPAWRRLEGGHKSSGFWRPGDEDIRASLSPRPQESSDGFLESDDEDEDIEVLARAARTKLPTGSLSPEKMSPDPDRTETTLKMNTIDSVMEPKTPVQENCK
ncbi:hypothetical protein IMZ48_40920 [Candidatus Bathyarchaeota archaeon]|nr:hypothetical protein [Candidatus Bathyarchaeota archaeon]